MRELVERCPIEGKPQADDGYVCTKLQVRLPGMVADRIPLEILEVIQSRGVGDVLDYRMAKSTFGMLPYLRYQRGDYEQSIVRATAWLTQAPSVRPSDLKQVAWLLFELLGRAMIVSGAVPLLGCGKPREESMFNFKRISTAAAILATAIVPAGAVDIFKGETAGAGGPVHTMFVAFTNQAGKADVEIQVNAGQTLTKSMLKGARGEIDFFSSVPSLVPLMAGQRAMYQNVENASELSKNLRSILGFKAGAYHPVTLDGSGIETWEDLKGKTIFTGPPAGSASATSEALIKIITGYEAGEDYTAVRLSWGEGYSALADGKIDMMVRPAEVGSANIERFGLSGKFRVLSIPAEIVSSDAMQALFGRPGRGMLQFDGGIYQGQLTEGTITALGFTQFVGTHTGVADDVVYKATKAFWENLDDVHATAFFLKEVTPETAFTAVNVPLHPGAAKYYDEAGMVFPDALRP